jgi:hypothetical protein
MKHHAAAVLLTNPSCCLCLLTPSTNTQQEQFRATGQEVRAATVQQMQEQLALFRSKLEEFAHKHKSDIRKDPVFRAQFHAMCANIGVDPLASNKVGARIGNNRAGPNPHLQLQQLLPTRLLGACTHNSSLTVKPPSLHCSVTCPRTPQ